MTKDKRKTIRIPLLAETVFVKDSNENYVKYDMKDITEVGCFIKGYSNAKAHDKIDIRFVLPNDLGMIIVEGEVVRVNWADIKKKEIVKGVGIQFTDTISPAYKKILSAYVIYLRNKQIIQVSKRLIEEFFNGRPPV